MQHFAAMQQKRGVVRLERSEVRVCRVDLPLASIYEHPIVQPHFLRATVLFTWLRRGKFGRIFIDALQNEEF